MKKPNPYTLAIAAAILDRVAAAGSDVIVGDEVVTAIQEASAWAEREFRKAHALQCMTEADTEGLYEVTALDMWERLREKHITAGPGICEAILNNLRRDGLVVRVATGIKSERFWRLKTRHRALGHEAAEARKAEEQWWTGAGLSGS